MDFPRLTPIKSIDELWSLPEGTIVVCRAKPSSQYCLARGFEKNVLYFGIQTQYNCFERRDASRSFGSINSTSREDVYLVDCLLVSESFESLPMTFSRSDFDEFEFAIMDPHQTVELFLELLGMIEKIKSITSVLPK